MELLGTFWRAPHSLTREMDGSHGNCRIDWWEKCSDPTGLYHVLPTLKPTRQYSSHNSVGKSCVKSSQWTQISPTEKIMQESRGNEMLRMKYGGDEASFLEIGRGMGAVFIGQLGFVTGEFIFNFRGLNLLQALFF